MDATGTASHVSCSTSTLTLRTRPVGGPWSAPSTPWTRPSGNDSMACSDLAVSSSGALAVAVTLSYWVGAPTYATRYALVVVTNESGSWTNTTVASNLTNYPSGRLRFDGTGALHVLSDGYWVRPAAGGFASEALPMGWGTTSERAMTVDRLGVLHFAWIAGSGTSAQLSVARRTGPGAWVVETTPLLLSVNSGASASYELFGLAFDAANQAHLLVDDGGTYRALAK